MDKLQLDESDRPLYLGYGGQQELLLHFAPDGDFMTTARIINAIRDELAHRGFPVLHASRYCHGNDTIQTFSIAFELDFTEVPIPETLIGEIRNAINVRCKGTGMAEVVRYYHEGRHLNTEAFITITDGQASPDFTCLEREGFDVTKEEEYYRFIVPEGTRNTSPDISAAIAAEALGIYLHDGIRSRRKDLSEASAAPQDEISESVPDNLGILQELWQHPAPPEAI
jgi:hypothetical protein